MESYDHDVEKEGVRNGSYVDAGGAVPGEMFVQGETLYAKVQRLAGRFHVEQRGIERVPENERDDHSLLNVGTMVRQSMGNVEKTHSLTSVLVALCQYGGLLFCDWPARATTVLPRIH